VKLSLSLLPVLLAGCAAQVSHPTKSEPEMRADIRGCTREANHKYWMDPVAALYNAYDCLEAKGYRREHGDLAGQVEQAMGQSRPQPKGPARACRVPCRRHR
jgi:hypothetical protein